MGGTTEGALVAMIAREHTEVLFLAILISSVLGSLRASILIGCAAAAIIYFTAHSGSGFDLELASTAAAVSIGSSVFFGMFARLARKAMAAREMERAGGRHSGEEEAGL